MTSVFVIDASVALKWFVAQPGHEAAALWLRRYVQNPRLFIAPDLFRFEVHGALARLQRGQEVGWAERCFERLDRLGLRTLPTTMPLFRRAHELAREVPMGGYDAVYLAHAEQLEVPWLTADERILRRLAGDPRVRALDPETALSQEPVAD